MEPDIISHLPAPHSSESLFLSPPPTQLPSRDSGSYLPSPPLSDRLRSPSSGPLTSQRMAPPAQELSSGLTASTPDTLDPRVVGVTTSSLSNPSARRRLLSYAAQLSRPLQGAGLGSSALPTSGLVILEHSSTPASGTLGQISSSPRGKNRRSAIDDEFRAAVKRAKNEYMVKHNLRPKGGSLIGSTVPQKGFRRWAPLNKG
jgi:hypothetical protein